MQQHAEVGLIHGIFHWVAKVVPGGWWTIGGFTLFGFSVIVWLKFHKRVDNFIWEIVRKKMDQRKP